MPDAMIYDNSLAEGLAEELNEHLKQRFGYKIRCAEWSAQNGVIEARRRPKMDIYLRFPSRLRQWYGISDTLVIARIKFREQRAGHGTWLLKLLVELAPKYGYANIGIEATRENEGIQNFVRKFGFLRLSSKDEDGPNNWINTVGDLQARLSAEVPA